jgi:hypothetical protein
VERAAFQLLLPDASPSQSPWTAAFQNQETFIRAFAGAYDTLPEAYAAIFPAASALRGFRLLGLRAIEIDHTVQVNPRRWCD